MFVVCHSFFHKVNLIYSRCSGRPEARDANQCDGGRCLRGMGHQVQILIIMIFLQQYHVILLQALVLLLQYWLRFAFLYQAFTWGPAKIFCLRLCYAKDYHHVFLADGRTLRWCPCITPSRRKRTPRALSGSPSLTTRLTRRRLPISVRVTIYLCPSQYCCLIKIESYYIRLLREFYMYIFTKPVSKLIKNIWLAFANLVLGKTLNPVTV